MPKFLQNPALWMTAGLLLVLTGLYFAWPGFQNFTNEMVHTLIHGDRQEIQDWIQQYGAWGPVVIITATTLQMFLIIAPSFLLMVIAVIAYGPWWGALIAVAAIAVASSIGYGLGNLLGEGNFERLVGEKTRKRMDKEVDRYGLKAVFIARLNPFLSNDAISFLGGFIGMGYWRFMAATVAGSIPLAAAIAAFGKNTDTMKWGLGIISFLSLLGLGAKIWYDKRKDRREDETQGHTGTHNGKSTADA